MSWQAGDDDEPAAGELELESGVRVRGRDGEIWKSSVAYPDARFLVVTDDGDLRTSRWRFVEKADCLASRSDNLNFLGVERIATFRTHEVGRAADRSMLGKIPEGSLRWCFADS